MGCSDCYTGSENQIPLDDTQFSEIPNSNITAYAKYLDGLEVYF